MSLSKGFKKGEIKNVTMSESDFNYNSNHAFFKFYKGCDYFDEM